MNIANCITISRLFIAVMMVPAIYTYSRTGYILAMALFILAIASDIADGFVARNFDRVSELGAKLDPLVDKILIYSVMFGLMHINSLEPILVFPMFIRDMIVDGLRNMAAETSGVLGANFWGKAKFSLQALSIMCSLGFCLTGGEGLLNSANFALLAALVISLPGLIVVVSVFDGTAKPRTRRVFLSRFF